MLTLSVDVSELLKIAAAIPGVEASFNAEIPNVLNLHGQEMYQSLVDSIAKEFDVPAAAVSNALSPVPATPGLPMYAIVGSNIEFPYVRWVTMRDEKVCQICGPRDGEIYRLNDAQKIHPAHPNCRCMLEAVDISGSVLALAPDLLSKATEDAVADLGERFATFWQDAAPMSIFAQRVAVANAIVDAEMTDPFWFQPMQEVVNAEAEIDVSRPGGEVRVILLQPGMVLGSSHSLNAMHERSTSEPTLYWMARGLLADVRRFDRFVLRGSPHNPDVATGTRAYEVGDGPKPIGFGRYKATAVEIVVPPDAVEAEIEIEGAAFTAYLTFVVAAAQTELPWA